MHTGEILVDGLGVGDVGNIVLRDRQHLAEDGILIVVLTLEKGSNQLLAGPDIVSRGFVYVRESEVDGRSKKSGDRSSGRLPDTPAQRRLEQDQTGDPRYYERIYMETHKA